MGQTHHHGVWTVNKLIPSSVMVSMKMAVRNDQFSVCLVMLFLPAQIIGLPLPAAGIAQVMKSNLVNQHSHTVAKKQIHKGPS